MVVGDAAAGTVMASTRYRTSPCRPVGHQNRPHRRVVPGARALGGRLRHRKNPHGVELCDGARTLLQPASSRRTCYRRILPNRISTARRPASSRSRRDPIFANVVLADGINCAPPKTQAALLEAMLEGQVSADGTTYQLQDPFFVIETRNPVEQEETFALPEAQRGRFIMKATLGSPDGEGIRTVLDRWDDRTARAPELNRVIDGETVPRFQDVPERVTVGGSLRDYMITLGEATRADGRVEVGVSPRGIQAPLRGQPGAGARERPGVRPARRRQGRRCGRVRQPARVDFEGDGPRHLAYDRGERHRRADRGPRGAARSTATGRRPPAKTATTSRFTPPLPYIRNTTAVVKVAFNFAWISLSERYRRDRG